MAVCCSKQAMISGVYPRTTEARANLVLDLIELTDLVALRPVLEEAAVHCPNQLRWEREWYILQVSGWTIPPVQKVTVNFPPLR